MIYNLFAFGFMVAGHFLYASDLETGTKLKYWATFIIGGFVISHFFDALFWAALFRGAVAMAYVLAGFSRSNSSSL